VVIAQLANQENQSLINTQKSDQAGVKKPGSSIKSQIKKHAH
jgi:hypothetical protein